MGKGMWESLRPGAALISMIVAAGLLAGCGDTSSSSGSSSGSDDKSAKNDVSESRQVFTQDNVSDLASASSTDEIKGAEVKAVVGQVFDVEREGTTSAFQVYVDQDHDQTLIVVTDDGLTYKTDEYVRFSGTVRDLFEGENGFGATLQIPRVAATEVKQVTAAAMDPPLKTYKASKTQTAAGVSVTVRRIEISEGQTRVYVRYKNNSADDFYSDVSLVADGEEVEASYDSDVKEPASNVSSGASTTGVLAFDPVSPSDSLRLTFDGIYDANFTKQKLTFVY